MPFNAIGWSEAAPGTGTPGVLAALNELLYTTQGDGIKIGGEAPYLLGVLYGAESTPGYAKLQSPSILTAHQFVKAVDADAITSPEGGFSDLRNRPLALKAGEYLTAYSNNATDEDTIIGAIVGNGKITQQMIDAVNITHKIRGSADQALTANTWTTVTMTWDQTLPEGRYAVVGMKFGTYKAANPGHGMARMLLTGVPWRPGVPMEIITGDKVQFLGMGRCPWEQFPFMPEITFKDDQMPKFECLSPYANTDHAVELDLVQVQ